MQLIAFTLALNTFAGPVFAAPVEEATSGPSIIENRVFEVTQTVTLQDVPEGARMLRMWVPVPSDGPWQRVVDQRILAAPGEWRLERQIEGRGDLVYVEVRNPKPGDASVVVRATVERQGVHFALERAPTADQPVQRQAFAEYLAKDSPLMEVDEKVQQMADEICGDEEDPARQALLLLEAVADSVDHYSKDPTVPTCGVGSAENCMTQGGGCCSDLHALFIALARAREIPSRIQFGYRALESHQGESFDPGYRCWVEFFVPDFGWVPTDIVASDGVERSHPMLWGSLSASRVWLWEGRSFDLTPSADAKSIDTMLVGWAEIDGKPVDVLPAEDGTPSRLGRTITFNILKQQKQVETAALPQ